MVESGSPAFKLHRSDWIKLLKSIGLAAAGAAIPILSDFFAGTDFGVVTPVVTAISSVMLNALRRWMSDFSQ